MWLTDALHRYLADDGLLKFFHRLFREPCSRKSLARVDRSRTHRVHSYSPAWPRQTSPARVSLQTPFPASSCFLELPPKFPSCPPSSCGRFAAAGPSPLFPPIFPATFPSSLFMDFLPFPNRLYSSFSQ